MSLANLSRIFLAASLVGKGFAELFIHKYYLILLKKSL